MAEMLLAKDPHVIETIPPDRSDQPLRESITKSVAGSVRAGVSGTVGLLTGKQELFLRDRAPHRDGAAGG
jgi:hypothetical protein